MCGICGIVAPAGAGIPAGPPHALNTRVWQMLGHMVHRGPQGSEVRTRGAAIFGMQRLAIRGLDDGAQPLTDADSGIIAVCNGEIDNHRELRAWLTGRGRAVTQATDVAILPALYLELGAAFVEKLDGVFAIALWDPRAGHLILARDRAGERPLFYRLGAGEARFATELAALVGDGAGSIALDRAAIADYLRGGCFVAPASPVAGIRKVGPGEIVTIRGNSIRHRRYWRWAIRATSKTAPSTAAFDEIFRAAVRRQSDVDVDYGFFLSGGLDSSLIAAVAQAERGGQTPRCYTLRFDEASYDEGGYAQRVARLLGLEPPVMVPVAPGQFIEELPRLVRSVGEPLADPAWIPTALLARTAARDVRIVFAGEGGDELFGGYPTYLGAGLAQRYARLPACVRAAVRGLVTALPPSERKVPLSFLLKRFVAAEGLDAGARHRLWTASVQPALLARLGVAAQPAAHAAGAGGATLDALQLHDFETTLAEGLLTKTDRGGMSASLEIRAPFLDRAVVEFCASLPAHARVRGFTTKRFLKTYAQKYLPRDIVHRRKRGLSVPLAGWLRGPLHEWADGKLRAGRLVEAGVDPAAARALLREHAAREADHARALWTLLVLDEWLAWALERSARPRALN